MEAFNFEGAIWDIGIQFFQIYHWPLASIFLFTRNKLLTNFPFDDCIFLVATFFNIPLTSSFTNSSLLNSLLTGKGFLTKKVLNEMGFCILLLCPKFWDLLLFSSKLPLSDSIFLLMERPGNFLTRINFLSVGETFLIPFELDFLDSIPCWRMFAGEQLYLPYFYCWLPVCL